MVVNSPTKLKVASWNANSLLNNIHELYHFLKTNKIDVCAVQETCFKDTTKIPSHLNYRWHCVNRLTDNGRTSGGVAICISTTLNYKLLSLPATKILECVGVKIFNGNQHIDIFSVYLPGGATNEQINGHYKNDIRLITQASSNYFIIGDLNSKHRA